MKAISKILNENHRGFEGIIRKMMSEHLRDEITFNELIQLLAKHNIKFFSPEQFKKMSKIFGSPYQQLPIHLPFQRIQLHSQQGHGALCYYMIRVLNKKNAPEIFSQSVRVSNHLPEVCLRDFVIMMKKRYGNQINWFKVMGGMTVAVSIEINIFQENLSHLLRNSPHRKCLTQLVAHFSEEKGGQVTWKRFMHIVKQEIKTISEEMRSRSNTTIQPSSHLGSREVTRKQRSLFNDSTFINTSNMFSIVPRDLSKSSYQTKQRPKGKTSYFFKMKTEGQTLQDFRLENKKCTIFKRMNTSFSFNEGKKGQMTKKQIKFSEMKKGSLNLDGKGEVIFQNKPQINGFRKNLFWKFLKQKNLC